MKTSKKSLVQELLIRGESHKMLGFSSTKVDPKLDKDFYQEFYPDLAQLNSTELVDHWKKYGIKEERHPNLAALMKDKALDPKVLGVDELDFHFYTTYYADIKEAGIRNALEAKIHYLKNGCKEGRFPNFVSLAKSKGIDTDETDLVVDFDFYTSYYEDINQAGLLNKFEAKLHYLLYGRKEGRLPSFKAWLEENGVDSKEFPTDIDFQSISNINLEFGVEVTYKDMLDLISGRLNYPLRISSIDSYNANFYLHIAKHFLTNHNGQVARSLLSVCMMFEKRAEFLELLGNTYYQEGDFQSAKYFYESAASKDGISKWLFLSLAECYKKLERPAEAIDSLLKGMEKNSEFSVLHDRLDEFVHNYWLKQQGILALLATENDREALLTREVEISSFIYNAYLRLYDTVRNPEWMGDCNLRRVLVVGDLHIPQCVHYRIDQKIEQLEAADKEVTVISWKDLDKEQNVLAFHDVVIFYRVPAEPLVLKAMAQVNATGKLSFYEIDDLLFEPVYPPPIENYGLSLSLDTYIEITKGMALFNAAARYCRFGIASTQLLAAKLQDLVFGNRCFVHRNALDSLNYFMSPVKVPKEALDIFYGSGTLAHNADFIDLALPGIVRILDEYPNTRLVIAGHLKLPLRFTEAYKDRFRQLSPVKKVQAYWSLLERSDINLAVLHDDEITGCKSELKWLEAACLGIPSIVSSTANYRDIIHHGEDALMAATPEEWYQSLKKLVDAPGLRMAMAERAQVRAQAEYGVDVLSHNICGLLEQALNFAQPSEQSKKKKIALVNVFFPPQAIGGATRVVADNFDILQKDYGDEFDLCVFTSDSECKEPYQMTVYSYQGVRIYRSTILWRENMDWHPCDEKMGELFKEFLAIEQPDLIHFHCVQRLTGSVVEAAQKANVPYIVTIHDAWWISDYQFLVDADGRVYPEGHPDPYEPRTLPNNVSMGDSIERLYYLKGLLKGAREVLTVSDAFAAIYRKNEIHDILLNKNGISESLEWKKKETSYTDKVVCAHIGGMAEHKGYFLLKTAVEKAQPKNIEMLVVDHSKDEGYIQKTHWGSVPVTFVGGVNQARVTSLYRQMDVLFAPSTWPESFGLVTREAAACGCWVVASSMGGIGEDVVEGESGFVVDPTHAAITECLKKIDRKHELYKKCTHSDNLRLVSEQVNDLTDIYKGQE